MIKNNLNRPIIFHIDCNSAFLSWSSVYQIQKFGGPDYRKMIAAVGGSADTRHGIILAKSQLCKPFGIQTGESIMQAKIKCKDLIIIPPSYGTYVKCSNAMNKIFYDYTPNIQKYSIDESFLDFTNMENLYPDPIELAHKIKDRIKNELGFTVSVGISENKLLAKTASELKKPDGVSTIWKCEVKDKFYKLDIRELFGCGARTEEKLRALNINTIGDLAEYDINIIKQKLKSYGVMLWNYAHGIDESVVRKSNFIKMKSIGNSTTVRFDVTTLKEANLVILSLVESVAMRLRETTNVCRLIEISYVNKDFWGCTRQRKLTFSTDSTKKIHQIALQLFQEVWQGEPVRKFGVRVSDLYTNEIVQATLFDDKDIEKQRKVDNVIDSLRGRFGSELITKAAFLHSSIHGLSMGMGDGEEDYPLMNSQL